MRTMLVSIFLVVSSLIANGQHISITKASNAKRNVYKIVSDTLHLGEIYLDDLSDDYGKITLSLSNSGNKPLLIKNVTGCCGTNIKLFPKVPVLPGKSDNILVEFRIEPKPQRISRTVSIESNAIGKGVFKIHIVGLVIQRRQTNELVL